MLDAIRGVLAFTQVGGVKIDAAVFRLNCSATVVLLCTFSATVFARQYVGNPIDCIHTRDVPEDVLNAFCWIHSTYTIRGAHLKKVGVEVPFPGVDHTKNWEGDQRKYTKYYQWVGFTLFIQDKYSIPDMSTRGIYSSSQGNQQQLGQGKMHHTIAAYLDFCQGQDPARSAVFVQPTETK